jgi:mRNA interferase RelE/StbE
MSYHLWIKNEAKTEMRRLPGHMRQQIRQAVQNLISEPRPSSSQPIKPPAEFELELRRIRLKDWRVIYVIDENWSEIGVLAVRKRPPYNYEDLSELLKGRAE